MSAPIWRWWSVTEKNGLLAKENIYNTPYGENTEDAVSMENKFSSKYILSSLNEKFLRLYFLAIMANVSKLLKWFV